jgi:hypothetical protein
MKIQNNDKKFEVCPEFKGRAVCVDVTPLKRYETPYGPKDKFKLVFEVDVLRADGSRPAVWSKPFTPSRHERSALASFLKDWAGGQPMANEDWDGFDTEDLIGRSAEIVVIHEHVDGETYANIKLIMPDRSGNPLKPSGKFVRQKDRPGKNDAGAYHPVEQPANGTTDLAATKIHVGRYKGLELRELSVDQVKALTEHWLPDAKANTRPTADDRRLIVALDSWQAAQRAVEDDNIPY